MADSSDDREPSRALRPSDTLAAAAADVPDLPERIGALAPALGRAVREALEAEAAAPARNAATLADLARAAGVPVAAFVDYLNCRGRPVAGDRSRVEGAASPAPGPEADGADVVIDVRPDIAAGHEPFSRLMAAADEVPPGGRLRVHAPFDPAPLRRVLAARGFSGRAEPRATGHWVVTFERRSPAPGDGSNGAGERPMAEPGEPEDGSGGLPGRTWREDGMLHLDVRDLEPPQPMVAILGRIEGGRVDEMVVHLPRDPVLLYPELVERGWSWRPLPAENGHVRLHLFPQR